MAIRKARLLPITRAVNALADHGTFGNPLDVSAGYSLPGPAAPGWRIGNTLRLKQLSLGTKLGIIVCACAILAMASGAYFVVYSSRIAAEQKANVLAEQAAAHLVSRVQTEFDQTFGIINTTHDSIVALWSNNIRDRHIDDVLLKQVLESNPDKFGAWVGWEPNAFDGHDADFVGQPNTDETGRYLTYWHQNGLEITIDKLTKYQKDGEGDFYRVPVRTGKPFLVEPYFLNTAGTDVLVTSFSRPIVVDDRIMGAMGIDLKLDPLRDAITNLDLPPGASMMLVSNTGIFVTAPDEKLVGHKLASTRPDLTAEFARAEAGSGLKRTYRDENGDQRIRSWSPITFGEVQTPWYVMVDIPSRGFAADAAREQITTIFVALAILATIVVAILLAMRQLVSRPLHRIIQVIKDLSGGLFALDVPETERADEIGAIARAISALQESGMQIARLREADAEKEHAFDQDRRREMGHLADQLSHSVQSVAHSVSTTAQTIEQRAQHVSDVAAQAARKIDLVANVSASAGSSVESLAAATAELSVSIDGIGAKSAHAQDVAAGAARQALESDRIMRDLTSKASRIGDIVQLINAIAGKTNMLALNATIEAARVGEAGRGFAIVAQEVKSLAMQTGKATEEITRQIADVQEASAGAVDTVTSISATIAEINAISVAIMAAVEQQGIATVKIGDYVGSAVAETRQVSENIMNVSTAAKQTGDAAGVMLLEIAKLTGESDRLNSEVIDFISRVRSA